MYFIVGVCIRCIGVSSTVDTSRVSRGLTPRFTQSWQPVVELVVTVVGRHIFTVAGSIRHIAGRSVGVAGRLAPRYRTRRPGSGHNSSGSRERTSRGVLPCRWGVVPAGGRRVVNGGSRSLSRSSSVRAERRRLGPTPRRDR